MLWRDREDGIRHMEDYRGAFDSKLSYADFGKEVLLEVLKSWAAYIRKLDGTWYLAVKEEAGDDKASACDKTVWQTMEVHDVQMTRRLFNIGGDDVTAVMKALQMSPWALVLEQRFELKHPNLGIWTVTRCPTLLALEKEGEGREERICRGIETELITLRAHTINPKIKVTPLQLPPRRRKDEVHCQWEFRLET